MKYVSLLQSSDVLAEQMAVHLLYFAQNEAIDSTTDVRVVVGLLWSFWATANRLAGLPTFQVPQPRRGIRDDVRDRVFARDGNRCLKCGSEDALEIDHVVPIARGGLDVEGNFQTLCSPCNRVKRTDPVDYRISALDFSFDGDPA